MCLKAQELFKQSCLVLPVYPGERKKLTGVQGWAGILQRSSGQAPWLPTSERLSPPLTSPVPWWDATGADLLEKNLVEIQSLRQRLEESICINDRLQERLEHVLSSADQGNSRKGEKLILSTSRVSKGT